MTPERLAQLEAAFARLIGLHPEARTSALQAQWGTDPNLRVELESLLSHAEPPEGFLEGAALGQDFRLGYMGNAEGEAAGTRIGPYQMHRRLASGGMGTVWLASRADGQFDQFVAIKLVKRGMDSEEVLRRFAHERRTLAGLVHPRIARLLDGGAAPDGRPYLVMEYVQGLPITHYCDAHRLSVTQRLRLFCAACDAVRFAHQKLVVHRDIKPGNVLVDEVGEPRLLDFGIAKVLLDAGEAQLTLSDERRFTPEYASPEQVSGQPLGTGTDLYSLGVVLYELLTGRRPYSFQTRTACEFERVVCTHEPPAPSARVERSEPRSAGGAGEPGDDAAALSAVRAGSPQRLRRRLSGDLDNIVLKAIHKDPNRRYASVDQFVADIERHLAGLPVMARADTFAYRVGKYARRNALSLSLAVCALAVVLGGAALAVWQARIARSQRDAAYLARDQAEATADFLQRMLGAADPGRKGPDARVGAVLDEAATRVEAELHDRPLVRASIRSTIGRTYLALGLTEQADKHIRSAYEARSRLLEPGHHDIAESQIDLAHLRHTQGGLDEAESLLEASLANHRRLRGEQNLDTARVWNDLGAVRKSAGKLADAETAYRRALDIREKLAGRDSLEAAETLNHLAGVLRARGNFSEAEKTLREVLSIRRRLLRDDHPLVVQSADELAAIAPVPAKDR